MNKFLHFNVNFGPFASTKQKRKLRSRTASVEPLPAAQVQAIADKFYNAQPNDEVTVDLNIGVTFLSLEDKYSKKEGRAEANKRIAKTTFAVEVVSSTRTHIFVQLHEYKGITLFLRLSKVSGFCTVTGNLSAGE